MGFIVGFLLLYSLTRMLDNGMSPKVCAIIYASVRLIFIFAFGASALGVGIIDIVITVIIAFGLGWLFFWLLDRFTGLVWWIIFIIGAFVLFI